MFDDVQHSHHSGKKEHILRKPLEEILDSSGDSEDVADQILSMLSERGLIQYAPEGTLSILSAAGRVLVCLLENPGTTIREISVRLGITEANVGRSVTQLAESKLIARTKVGTKYNYTFNEKELEKHPDIRRLYFAIKLRTHLDTVHKTIASRILKK
jgi:predicted transcriptional regulator